MTRDQRVVFTRGNSKYTARDVMDWGFMRGEIEPLWRESQRTAACERLAQAQSLEAEMSSVNDASIAFRYDHDLITAEETERWLQDRCLSLEDFGQYFTRQFWGRSCPGPMDEAFADFPSASAEEKERFLADLTLTGELDQLAERLSWRVAARAESGDEEAPAAELDPAGSERFRQLDRGAVWEEEVRAGEAAYQGHVASFVTEKDLGRELVSLRLMLTRFRVEIVEVQSRDAAAEVLACVRSDGMTMVEVAEESRYPFRQQESLLEDLPQEQQQRFLSVKAGALLEPIARGDSFEVWRVIERIEPSLQDAAVRQRIEHRLVARHFEELVGKFITWRLLQNANE